MPAVQASIGGSDHRRPSNVKTGTLRHPPVRILPKPAIGLPLLLLGSTQYNIPNIHYVRAMFLSPLLVK